jgi:two-component system NtrC family response regulator
VADLELAAGEAAMPDLDLRAARSRAEREVLLAALGRSNNTLTTAARLLGISRPTLYGLMEAHGIEIEGMKQPIAAPDSLANRTAAAKTG